jgi:sterol desaturase/sphingolipid hydroxylase (fatty acid hydroxylase superfamily)
MEKALKTWKESEMVEISVGGRLGIFAFIFFLSLIAESWIPLRKSREDKPIRVARNLVIALVGAIVLRFVFFPLVIWTSRLATEHQIGVLNQIQIPTFVRFFLALLFLDYTLYFWHRMNHQIPFLWRFHNVHHIDLDLDVSTASRFHFGELVLSAFFRMGQVLVLGIDIPTLVLYEICTTGFAQFHHSNVYLPLWLERNLNKIIVSPRMHGIHHSTVRSETDSNYGTIFTFWDRIHSTFVWGLKQMTIVIGVPSYQDFDEQTILRSLKLPFLKQREWEV